MTPRDVDVIQPMEEWRVGDDYLCFTGTSHIIYIFYKGTWAEVIKPAPAPIPDTLQPGDAVECGPEMREAIRVMAKANGLAHETMWNHTNDTGVVMLSSVSAYLAASVVDRSYKKLPLHEFIRRLENTPPKPKELTEEVKMELLKESTSAIDALLSHYEGNDTAGTAWSYWKKLREHRDELAEYGIK